jgi:peptidoglycan/LPS O-acetylase OafA/YrhL
VLLMTDSKQPLYCLTSIRFFGSLAVFFFHALEICRQGSDRVVFGSASAVSLFFVLSGFILVYIYSEKIKDLGFFGFLYKRLIRLWPLHIICLVLYVLCLYVQISPGLQVKFFLPENYLGKLLLQIALLQNWATSGEWIFAFNGSSWFVATELGFCVLFPFLCRVKPARFWLAYLLIILLHIVGLAVSNQILLSNPEWRLNIFYVLQCNPLFRLTEFASGMLVGYIFLAGIRLPGGSRSFWLHLVVEILAFAALFLTLHVAIVGEWMLSGARQLGWVTTAAWLAKGGSSLVTSMFLIWVLASSRGPISLLLSQPLLVYLGKISYAFYMIHSLVLLMIVRLCPKDVSTALMILCGLVISLAVASLLNMLVETPMRNRLASLWDPSLTSKHSFTAEPISKMIFPVALTCLTALLGVWGLWMESTRIRNPITLEAGQLAFQSEATLHFVDAETKGQNLELTLVWEKLEGGTGQRFTHIVENEQSFRHWTSSPEIFRNGRVSVERLSIPLAELRGATGVGIGFFRKGENTTSGFRNRANSFSGWRLIVYDCLTGEVPPIVKQNTQPVAMLATRSDKQTQLNPPSSIAAESQ